MMRRFCVFLLFCIFNAIWCQKSDSHDQRTILCALPREPGACKDSINRWYFDTDGNVCKEFEYTGCAGNGNNFDTEGLCQKTCSSGSVIPSSDQNCAQKRKSLVNNGTITDKTFVPNCASDGSYSASQCNGGHCWCVNPKTGEEINGTRTDSGQEPSFCEGSKKCPNEIPLTDIHGVEIFCGTGSNHQDCPDEYDCNKHPRGLYAVCCKHEDKPTVAPRIVHHGGSEDGPVSQQDSQVESDHGIANLIDINHSGEMQKWGKCSTNSSSEYAPRCTSEGHYQWVQCESDKNSTCWCVDPETGEEMIGTRKNELISCVDCYSNGPLLSNFKPQCEIPPFIFKQTNSECPSFVTSCGCMDPNSGKDIEGSVVGPGEKFPTCIFMPTFRGSCNTTAMMEPDYRGPACSFNGFFSPLQCEIKEGVGYSCFCADPSNMKKIQGTRVQSGKTPDCPKCLISKYMALDYLSIGAFVPQCTETGEFNPLQCNNRTGVCFCVYTDGSIVPGTRNPIGDLTPDCVVTNKSNQAFAAFAINPAKGPKEIETGSIPESHKPGQPRGKCVQGSHSRCTKEGFYEFVQCGGGQCWCVNPETNLEVDGTRKAGNLTCLDCLASGPLVVNFMPRCDFTPKLLTTLNNDLLCPISAKSCGCMDQTTGATIPGHDVAGGQPISSCEFLPAIKGPCNSNSSSSDSSVYNAQCTKNGFFVPVQCDQDSCWCVDPETNKELPGFRVKQPILNTPTCTKCLFAKAMALEFFPVAFLPYCKDNGDFFPVQCDNKTGSCFCVEQDGTVLPGSRQTDISKRPDCYAGSGSELAVSASEIASKNNNAASIDDSRPCLKELKAVQEKSHLKSGPHSVVITGFIPRCTKAGFYEPLQCHGSTGFCWCVTKNGTEITGTRSGNGKPRPVCNRDESTDDETEPTSPISTRSSEPCKAVLTSLGENPPPGAFVPNCTETGLYHPLQCHPSTGYCWCVTEDGTAINGTKVAPGHIIPVCEEKQHSKPAKPAKSAGPCSEKLAALGDNFPPGTSVPRCNEKGDYKPLQCNPSTGMCWCVTENGTEIAGTRTSPGKTAPVCEQKGKNSTKEQTRHPPSCSEDVAALGKDVPPGAFVPNCTEQGIYQPMQCHPSTGYCWCVNGYGKEVEGTRVAPGKKAPICEKNDPVTVKEQTRHPPSCLEDVAAIGKDAPPGTFVPNCTEQGIYQPMQCHPSTGYCWCVNGYGKEVEGTRVAPGNKAPVCEQKGSFAIDDHPRQLPSCLEDVAVLGKDAAPGTFIPNCTESGYYAPMQCHPSTGYCWCATENGTEIAGTKVAPGRLRPVCERKEPINVVDLKILRNGPRGPCRVPLEADSPPGAFNPRCTESGFYKPRQCHGSTGQCWCATPEGKEINGTRKSADQGMPDCTSSATASAGDLEAGVNVAGISSVESGSEHKGPCREALKLLGDKILLGRYVPQCNENGNYRAKQCHSSTGVCWCVTSNGTEIADTRKKPGNGTLSCSSEIEDIPVEPSIELPPGEVVQSSGANPCNLPKDHGSCSSNDKSISPQTRWYYSNEKSICLAFKYSGCGGNGNNFRSTSDCDVRCRPQDGPTCNGNGNSRPYTTNVTMTGPALGPGQPPKRIHCSDVQCPAGFKCRMGWMSPACCNETIEELFDEAYSPTCADGRKAYSVKSDSDFRSPFFGDSCDDLLCPKDYACNQSNIMFAKCCPTSDFVIDTEPRKEEISVCPTGTPMKDFPAGGYRLCSADSSCPNGSFCWNSSNPHERIHVQGVCCPAPRVPASLKKVLAKQNCTLQTREHIDECLKPFDNITKKFSSLSVMSRYSANVGDLFPENATIVSLNETCSKYHNYKQCTKDIYKPTFCYNHKNHMVDEILGFACRPETIALFLKNKHCLEDIVKDDSMKQCVIQFAQTMRVLGDGGERSFGGLCVSIERFIECARPSIVANCSTDLFGLIREFVNRTVDVVFGGTCREVVEDERSELSHQVLPNPDCTIEQTQALEICTQKFIETPVVTKNFPVPSQPMSFLITKQQLDSVDSFCAAYKVYDVCAQRVVLADKKCKPFVYQALENVVGFNCKDDIVQKWKKFGPCVSQLSNKTDVKQCFEILANVQKDLNTSKGVDPPLDKLCAQTESHVKCMEKPVSDQCGKETYDFYSLIYANSKRFLFLPCYQFPSEDLPNNEHEVEGVINRSAKNTAENSIDLPTDKDSHKSVQEEIVSNSGNISNPISTNGNSSSDKRACSLRRDSMLWASTIPSGQYIPQCSDNGEYKPVQCDPAKGTCWCVDETSGDEIQGTSVHSSENKTASCGPCHKARAEAVAHQSASKFVPVCQENGKFHHLQCSIDSGDCWCVDVENGTQIAGSKVGPGKKLPTCGVKEVYACNRLPLKFTCMPDGSKPQEVFRWYRDNDKCKIYRFNYCTMEAHVPPYPLKEQKDCERLCIGKQSDFVSVPT